MEIGCQQLLIVSCHKGCRFFFINKAINMRKLLTNAPDQAAIYLHVMEYTFSFAFASREFPPISVFFIVYEQHRLSW